MPVRTFPARRLKPATDLVTLHGRMEFTLFSAENGFSVKWLDIATGEGRKFIVMHDEETSHA